ncbi:DUF7289 family protein [Natrinema soli]|uniref:Flagellin n=1 Tax=Natrinema soli TaxID=1930624 RepID=A0ABD5SHR9_9EURY|nr:flagellin [Natrinema soli]
MANKEGGDWRTTRDSETRAASPVIGIILLFALVMMGAMLVFVAGSAMFDAIQSEADREQAQQFMLETDHRLSTVAETKTEQVLPDGVGPADVTGDGRIEVAWYANGSSSDPWSDPGCSVADSLGTLEYEQAGGTIAHQGGGVWETTNGQTRIVSEPDIGYDNDTLKLQILQLDNGDFGGSEAVARADHSRATKLTEEIKQTAAGCPNGTNVAFRITSSYHEGWYQYLQSEFDGNASVTHDPGAENVTVRIENVREPFDPAMFIVAKDYGLQGPGGKPLNHEQRLARSLTGKSGNNGNSANNGKGGGNAGTNAVFSIKTTIENTGERKDSQNISVSIWDEELNAKILEKEHRNLTIDDRDTKTIGHPELKFELNSTEMEKFSHGETYKYLIETEDDVIDTPGAFYVGTANPYFEVSNVDHKVKENVTITAEVQNIGIENTSDQSVDLELEYLDDETPDAYENIEASIVNGTYGATTTVKWTINSSRMLYGNHSYRIDTGDERSDLRTFTITTGVDPGETELHLDPGNQVNVSVLGTEVSAEGPTGEARVELTGGDKKEGKWQRDENGKWDVDLGRRTDNGGWEYNGDYEPQWVESGGRELRLEESEYGDWTWNGPGEWKEYDVYQKQWAPVTTEIITQTVNEEGVPTGDRNTLQPDNWGSSGYGQSRSPEAQNLNTHDTRDKIWRYNFTTQERVSLTLSSTLHSCGDYDKKNTDMYSDGETYDYHDTWSEYDGNGYWDHYDCMDISGESLNVDATTGSNNANVRVRDSENNTVPELRAGHQRQQSADEVLEHGDRDLFGGEFENGTGYLDLKEDQEFVFLFELTDEAPGSMDPDDYWDQAKETNTPGDPNFNDVIVLVEVDKIPTADIAAPAPVNEKGDQVDVGEGKSDNSTGDKTSSHDDPGIEVNTDHIVVG